ncbi:MAG: hypothetical protein ABT20_13775 [Rubrivivax sp. SCN 70-15]|nr:MAG: hypothetical protein ABT20_13775 [Rubrivivax sp. SCN 70-15]
MFFAALRSAFSVWPQATQANSAWLLRFSAAVWQQALHAWLVYADGTARVKVVVASFMRPAAA